MSDASVNANTNSDVGAKSMPHAKGQSMFARIAWAVVLGFVLLHIVGYFLYGHERMLEGARTFAMSTAERAYELDQVVTHQPELLPHFNTQWFTLAQIATPKLLSEQRWPHNEEVQAAVLARLQTLGLENDAAVQMAYSGGPRGKFEIQFPSQSGGYVYAQASTLLANRSYASPAGLSTSLLFLVVVGAVLWVTRRVTKQLDRFSAAAVALGEGYESQTLPENVGPKELRRASVAFNGMQRRVMSLLRERSDMLAGVSHDLRTLVTRLALRLEQIDEDAQKDKARQDVSLMTALLDQALTFARDEHSEEKFVPSDLLSLLQSIVDERLDVGDNVTLLGSKQAPVTIQPTAVTRLFENLVDNAIKYGGSSEIALAAEGVTVWDPGGGFDISLVDKALAPYERLEAARSQGKPGSGLGLAIVHNVCQRHGWQLSFAHIDEGFMAKVTF